jgi:hypothetical protein
MNALDFLFGWLLRLPPDAALIAVAVLSGTVLTLVRKWTTDQDLLKRAAADNRRLAELMRDAKRVRDKEALARHRATKARVGLIKFKAEGKPLLISLVPIALIAMWAFQNLQFVPPRPGEVVEVVASAPLSAAGEIVHLVPEPGLEAPEGWVRALGPDGGAARATWRVKGDRVLKAEGLTVRGRDCEVALRLKELKLFGVVPGIPALHLPAWMVGYLLIVLLFVPLFKKIARIW